MSVTRAPAGELEREPMCRVEWCPFPSSPEFHECWCGRLDVEHHHVDPRGMGGSPERRDDPDNIQCVCPPHHKAVTTEGYTDEIADGYYIVRNPKGARIVKHPRYQPHSGPVLSAAAEVGEPSPSGGRVRTGSAAAPSAGRADRAGSSKAERPADNREHAGSNPARPDSAPSPGEGSSEGEHQSYKLAGAGSNPAPPTTLTHEAEELTGIERRHWATSPKNLTHEQRVAIAQEIKDAQQRRQFLAGDTANLWEEELGEDFWNLYANEFGYTYPSLRNVMRVCKAIPASQRHDKMSFAHHEAVKTFDIEARDAWLERAFEEEWPVKRLREELVAEGLLKAKAKTRKWALEQLREAAKEWGANGPVQEFLEWLQQRS